MTDLTIDDSLCRQLEAAVEPIALRNREGQVVGHFVPANIPVGEDRNPTISEEEINERLRQGGGRPLSEWIAETGQLR